MERRVGSVGESARLASLLPFGDDGLDVFADVVTAVSAAVDVPARLAVLGPQDIVDETFVLGCPVPECQPPSFTTSERR
ncbi:hypothetical protein GCM10010182_04480 [Actinomadura cremea]|nr:hypothetical protein GCM10010182_04480 [Actinomadura cremea]